MAIDNNNNKVPAPPSGTDAADWARNNEARLVARWRVILSASPDAKLLLKTLDAHGIRIRVNPDAASCGYVRPDPKRGNRPVIGINPLIEGWNEGAIIGTLAHELAHADQFVRGFDISLEHTPHPRDIILMDLLREADADAKCAHICHQLRQAGYSRPWNHRMRHVAPKVMYGYLEGLKKNKTNAMRKAVLGWFDTKRRQRYHIREIIAFMDANAARHGRIVNAQPLTRLMARWLRRIGERPGQASYLNGTNIVEQIQDKVNNGGINPHNEARLREIEIRLGLLCKYPRTPPPGKRPTM
ncbi:MAG: DUF6782 family putative metallopeptidase [Pseudomonadota bacterium]|nr:DUF6782 family putative metallopeptidase [Pseudomonadota bacterium]